MKRKLYLLLGTVAMCTYGLMYNWTVFSSAIQNSVSCSVASASMVFSFSQISFCSGGLFSGFLYRKLNFTHSMIIAACMIGAGLLLTSYGTDIKQMYLTYSVMLNLGAGFAYKSLLTAIIAWFPDNPGFASGVLLMGMGLSAFIFNLPTTYAIQLLGWRNSMRLLSLIVFTISFIGALIIKQNQADQQRMTIADNDDDVTTKNMLHSSKFYIYFAWSILLLAGCTSISGNAVLVAKSVGVTVSVAAILSMVISLFNSLSRVVYGIIYDKKGRKMAMTISTVLFALAVISLFIVFVLEIDEFIFVAFVFIGLSFGAVPSISSTYILKTFGKKYYPSNFSIQGTYSLFSSIIGTTLFGLLYSQTNTLSLSFSYLIIYAIVAFGLLLVLNQMFKKSNTEVV